MAISDVSSNLITIEHVEEEKLKRMEFVHTVSLQALDCATKVYDIAKDKSGPLKTGVEAVEGKGYDVVAIASPDRYALGLDISSTAIKKAKEKILNKQANHFMFLLANVNMCTGVQNRLLNVDENIYIPISKAEFAVFNSMFNVMLVAGDHRFGIAKGHIEASEDSKL